MFKMHKPEFQMDKHIQTHLFELENDTDTCVQGSRIIPESFWSDVRLAVSLQRPKPIDVHIEFDKAIKHILIKSS